MMHKTCPTSGKVRFLRISKAAALELRRMVLDHLLQKPHSLAEMLEATGATKGAIAHQLYWLNDLGYAECTGRGPKAVWSATDHYRQKLRDDAAALAAVREVPFRPPVSDTIPIVRVDSDEVWTLPAAEVTIENGVRITRQAAPAPRFAVRLQPGTGVISLDNHGLASLAKRREAAA